jgi:hypothetical protein
VSYKLSYQNPLQNAIKATIAAKVKYTRSIDITVAVGLYLDELEATVSGLEEDAVQSLEFCESDVTEAAGEDEVPKHTSQHIATSDKVRKVSEVQGENALLQIEEWCDLWLSGKIAEEQWHSFEDCFGFVLR